MSSEKNPPAFPNTGNSTWDLRPASGMSLRDWFAGQAIGAVIRQCASDSGVVSSPAAYFAAKAYEVADAMLAARSENP